MTTYKIPRSLIGAAIASALVIAPAAVFAQDHGDNGQNIVHAAVATASAPAVSIAANGKVTVSGATVTSVGSGTLTATTVWGSSTLTWTINTANAKFAYKGGASATGSAVVVGDSLAFTGTLNTSAGAFAVNAATVRDLSREKPAVLTQHTFEGKITAAIGTTSLPATFTLVSGNTNFSVSVPVGAAVLTKNWGTTNLGTFQANDTVRVYGSAEASSSNTIDAVVVRDATR